MLAEQSFPCLCLKRSDSTLIYLFFLSLIWSFLDSAIKNYFFVFNRANLSTATVQIQSVGVANVCGFPCQISLTLLILREEIPLFNAQFVVS